MNTIYDFSIQRDNDEVLLKSLADYDEQKIRKSEAILNKPFEMEVFEGTIMYDIIGFEDTSNFAISEKVYLLLKENHITGWKVFDIRIKNLQKKIYGFQVTGRCGKIETPKEAGFYTGYKFDHNTWDNSDFFIPEETMLLFCTTKVKELFIKHNISNVEFVNIENVRGYSFGN